MEPNDSEDKKHPKAIYHLDEKEMAKKMKNLKMYVKGKPIKLEGKWDLSTPPEDIVHLKWRDPFSKEEENIASWVLAIQGNPERSEGYQFAGALAFLIEKGDLK